MIGAPERSSWRRVSIAGAGIMVAGIMVGALSSTPLAAQKIAVSTTISPTISPASGTTRFEVDGVRIIHRKTENNLVVANLYLLGGTRLATQENAGLESMLLEVTERGSRKYPGDQLRRALVRTGSEIGVSAVKAGQLISANRPININEKNRVSARTMGGFSFVGEVKPKARLAWARSL